MPDIGDFIRQTSYHLFCLYLRVFITTAVFRFRDLQFLSSSRYTRYLLICLDFCLIVVFSDTHSMQKASDNFLILATVCTYKCWSFN